MAANAAVLNGMTGFGPAKMAEAVDPGASLVEQCLSGNESAWEELVRFHHRRVYSICYRFTGSDGESQDIAQEVFLRVFQSLKSYRAGEGSFQVWLTRLTRNLLIDHYRRGRMQRMTEPIEDQLPRLEQGQDSMRAEAALDQREANELLQGALQRMSPELREAVILRDLEELEYREIAEMLRLPEGTVKSRINRGRAELARLLYKQKGMAV